MKPNYENWMPKWMVVGLFVLTGIALAGAVAFLIPAITLSPLFAIGAGICILGFGFCLYLSILFEKMRVAFDYNSDLHLMKTVAEGTVKFVQLREGQKGLDVGCGSGALTIALAKLYPDAEVIGIDRWGKEYASFNKPLCENNAKAEGVTNVSFMQGNALSLPFEDESFDAIVSNYVYHNIPSKDRQSILLETLRTLKKGGSFAIHDIFSKGKYGDMDAFVRKLKEMGYQEVELLDTTDGVFFKSKKEAKRLALQDSRLLKGIK
ncbi:MAG: methyltransferase domain-containing protein [Erysipelotrichaceae bacterium]|jgi:ubiquinone/menaquinone biosynthesis C-methylase UbiE|nr:methyltransferase domain-containing protein [Erysipelotrichaceae bacterium]